MSKKYKIAFTGVFDLENFGDQLFPHVFMTEMSKRGLDIELYLFSIFATENVMGEKRHVYPISEMEKMHLEMQFDAIVVGGGELIHFYAYEHKNVSGDYTKYRIFDLWVVPSLIANKYNIPLLWNVPGVPYEFEGMYKIVAHGLLEVVDYLAVRTEFSVKALKDVTDKEVYFSPDTGFLVKELYEPEKLEERKVKLLQTDAKYVVFHASKLMPEGDYQSVSEALKKYADAGYKVILLPMAYTNGDDQFLKKFNEYNGNCFFEFQDKLSVFDIISILAGCDTYIGFSFHGAIAAFTFGKRAISYNYTKNQKTRDLFMMMQQQKYYTESGDELRKLVDEAADVCENHEIEQQVYHELANAIGNHFDRMAEILKNKNVLIKKAEIFNCSEMLEAASDQILKYKEEIGKIQADQQQIGYIRDLEKNIQVLNEIVAEQKKGIEAQNSYVSSLEGIQKNQQDYIHTLENNVNQQQGYIGAVENNVKQQQDYIRVLENNVKQQQDYIGAVENNVKQQQDYIQVLETNVQSQQNYIQAKEKENSDLQERCEKTTKESNELSKKLKEQKVLTERQQAKLMEQAEIIDKVKRSIYGKLFMK